MFVKALLEKALREYNGRGARGGVNLGALFNCYTK